MSVEKSFDNKLLRPPRARDRLLIKDGESRDKVRSITIEQLKNFIEKILEISETDDVLTIENAAKEFFSIGKNLSEVKPGNKPQLRTNIGLGNNDRPKFNGADFTDGIEIDGISTAENHHGTSDKRLKSAPKKIESLPIIRDSGELYRYKKNGVIEVGKFAQDLLHCKGLVYTAPHNRLKRVYTVSGLSLAAIAFNGVKELDEENRKLKKSISDLEKRLEKLEGKMEARDADS